MQNVFPDTLDIDKHRISTIRGRIDENAYVVNTRQIADRIIAIEIALCDSLLAASASATNA